MSNVAKLKKKAAELEERRQYDKALAVYEQVLTQMGESDDDVDVSLYNRVGDLTLRQGNVTQAVSHYERAVDLYTEGGFFNNAIALCNKILRNAPGRVSIYYKLGKISARKGFTSDAKQNFLEFADRMQKSGAWEEAFAALKEFADLCPDQDDVRLMLAEQLTRKDRKQEALVQLQILYGRYQAEGRTTEANATLDRMRSIDPDIVPQASHRVVEQKSGDLVFLDLSYDEPENRLDDLASRDSDIQANPPARHTPVQPPDSPLGGRRDPRWSGEMHLIQQNQPGETLNSSQSPDLHIMRHSDYLGVNDGSPDLMESGEQSTIPDERSADDYAVHDLALAGILPNLDTPGLHVQHESPLGDDVEPSSGLREELEPELSDFERQAIAESGLAEELPSLEMPELVLPEDQQIDLDVGALDTSLLIVHGNGPGDAAGGQNSQGAESLRDAPIPTEGVELTSALSRESLKSIAWSIADLEALLRDEPGDFALVRRLGEVLIEEGRREDGLLKLEEAIAGFEAAGSVSDALSVTEEILRLEPNAIKHHQKRVEYSFRSSDQGMLVDSYLELADALFRTAQMSKARVVYERVLELSSENVRAKSALTALVGTAETSEAERPGEKTPIASAAVAAPDPVPPSTSDAASDFVNLGDLLREDDEPRSTRMVVDEEAPSGDEEADFAEMLEKFKRGLAENVDDEDYESHFDLGVAFREMGLLDEAIAQFQRALRGTKNRVRTLEALGQCFVERSQFQIAVSILERALSEGELGDENLVGVLYLLGYASEAMQKYKEAVAYYQRVFMVDIQFRDVVTRITALEKMVNQ